MALAIRFRAGNRGEILRSFACPTVHANGARGEKRHWWQSKQLSPASSTSIVTCSNSSPHSDLI